MPFKSKAQVGYLFANKPNLAKKWADKYGAKPKPKSPDKAKYGDLMKAMKRG